MMLGRTFFLTWCAWICTARQEHLQLPKHDSAKRYRTSEQLLEFTESHDLDVWYRDHRHIDIYLPDSQKHLQEFLPKPLTMLVTEPLPGSPNPDLPLEMMLNSSFHSSYHELPIINSFLRQLVATWPDTANLLHLGYSGEGREMLGIRIARRDRKKKDRPKRKRTIIIQGAQHAREWVASATALYVAHALLVPKEEPGSMHKLLDGFDFHIIPVPNPDGYTYTWTEDRLWYKNRMSLGPDARCKGLDMNRNWGFHWSPASRHSTSDLNFTDLAQDSCSHWYPGSRPFEAPEVNNIANYVYSLKKKAAFIDLRSYGQMISSPYSYSCEDLPAEEEDLLEAAAGAAKGAQQVHGRNIRTGTLCQMLYSAPGNVVDYMYGTIGIKYSYAFHLRDTGTYGYLLPPDQIRPTGEETMAMLSSIVKFILDH